MSQNLWNSGSSSVPAMLFHCCLRAAPLCVAALRAAGDAPPAGLFCAPFGSGGTWNMYQTSTEPLSWVKAQEVAAAATDPRGGTHRTGHLVTIGSAAENMFVRQFAAGAYLWIGLTDNEKCRNHSLLSGIRNLPHPLPACLPSVACCPNTGPRTSSPAPPGARAPARGLPAA